MPSTPLTLSHDVSAATWIAPRLTGDFGAVSRTVPDGFEAYVRICHPAYEVNDNPVTWSEVAAVTGRRAHPLMQWHALVGSSDPSNMTGSLWPGSNPELGNLAAGILNDLCDILAAHTATPQRCWFCVWDGYGWDHTATATATGVAHLGRPTSTDPDPGASAPGVRPEGPDWRTALASATPRVRLPARDYLLAAGPLSSATRIGTHDGTGQFAPQPPNLFWPSDRTWCVASEIDFDSTLVGGTTTLTEAILTRSTFDAWTVRPDDSLASDADHINRI